MNIQIYTKHAYFHFHLQTKPGIMLTFYRIQVWMLFEVHCVPNILTLAAHLINLAAKHKIRHVRDCCKVHYF